MDPSSSRVASRYIAGMHKENLGKVVQHSTKALHVLGQIRSWLSEYPHVLREAEREDSTGLEPGEVWQDRISVWWGHLSANEKLLSTIADELEVDASSLPSEPTIQGRTPHSTANDIAYNIEMQKSLPRAAQWPVTPVFRPHPTMGRHHVAYSVHALNEWHTHFSNWLSETERNVASLTKLLTKFEKFLP